MCFIYIIFYYKCSIYVEYNSGIMDNRNLATVIINFANSTVKNCDFNNINIVCYESQTCESIQFKNKIFTDAEAKNELKSCTLEEINKFFLRQANGGKNIKKIWFYIIIICSILWIGCLSGVLLIVLFRKEITNLFKRPRELNFSPANEEFRNGSIKVVFSRNTSSSSNNNDGANNVNTNINTSNNDISNVDSNNNVVNAEINSNNYDANVDVNHHSSNNSNNNNSISNNIQGHLNTTNNLSPNSIVNSHENNAYPIPGTVVFINNSQPPGNYVLQNLPLSYDYDNKSSDMIMNTNINTTTTTIPSTTNTTTPNSSNNNNNHEMFIYYTTVANEEEDEPPPEYSEYNKTMAKQQFI